jgi:signal peptidase II
MSRRVDLRRHAAWIVFAVLAAAIVVSDQLLKHWIVANYRVDTPTQVVGEWVRVNFIHNTGGLFGLFQNAAPLFALVSLGVIAIIVGVEFRWAWQSWIVTLALGLLLGGAIGNLIDRISLGYVVDFADVGIGSWRWYIFNVADSAISTSIGVLLLVSLISPRLLAGRRRDETAGAGGVDERRGSVAR